MEEQKPKSVKTIGILIIIFSCFIIFSNFSGMMAWQIVGNESYPKEFHPMNFILMNYIKLCLFMISVGILFLIGGIYLRKYKLWANKLITVLSGLLVLIIWAVMLLLAISVFTSVEYKFFGVLFILNAIIWSTPLVLLIRFLNKSRIKQHFI